MSEGWESKPSRGWESEEIAKKVSPKIYQFYFMYRGRVIGCCAIFGRNSWLFPRFCQFPEFDAPVIVANISRKMKPIIKWPRQLLVACYNPYPIKVYLLFLSSMFGIFLSLNSIWITRSLWKRQTSPKILSNNQHHSWPSSSRASLKCPIIIQFYLWDQSHVTIVWNTRETGDIHVKKCY